MRIPGNFDRWMFNYKEGNLSADEMAYFEDYLASNPDFAEDIEAWDNAFVRQEALEYPHVNSLLKDKSLWANWKPWAAVVALLLTVAGGIGFGSNMLSKGEATYAARAGQDSNVGNVSSAMLLSKKGNQLSLQTVGRAVLNKLQTKSNATFSATKLQSATASSLNRSAIPYNTAVGSNQSINKTKIKVNQKGGIFKGEKLANRSGTAKAYKAYRKGKADKSSAKEMAIEVAKINGESQDFTAGYQLNPDFSVAAPTISFSKNKTGLLAYRVKRFLNKIDKISGYPIALVNLRDPELLVPNRNVLNFNPAFAGGGGNFRIGADYRSQWTGESVNNQINTVYFDTYSSAARGGIGGSVTYSSYGDGAYQNMTANLYYSPKLVINKHMVFEPAIKVTMGNNRRNANGNNIPSAIEMDRGRLINQGNTNDLMSNQSWYKDYGLGFVLNTDWFYVGGFVDNLGGHDQRIFHPSADNVAESPHLITGVIGFDFQSRNKKTTLSPFLTYYQYGALKEAWAGATAQFNWLTLGASYSSNNEYAASVGLKFKSFKLMYQIDQTDSEFLQESFVSHNIGIRFNTKNKTIR